jgi:hypothetical protein
MSTLTAPLPTRAAVRQRPGRAGVPDAADRLHRRADPVRPGQVRRCPHRRLDEVPLRRTPCTRSGWSSAPRWLIVAAAPRIGAVVVAGRTSSRSTRRRRRRAGATASCRSRAASPPTTITTPGAAADHHQGDRAADAAPARGAGGPGDQRRADRRPRGAPADHAGRAVQGAATTRARHRAPTYKPTTTRSSHEPPDRPHPPRRARARLRPSASTRSTSTSS